MKVRVSQVASRMCTSGGGIGEVSAMFTSELGGWARDTYDGNTKAPIAEVGSDDTIKGIGKIPKF